MGKAGQGGRDIERVVCADEFAFDVVIGTPPNNGVASSTSTHRDVAGVEQRVQV